MSVPVTTKINKLFLILILIPVFSLSSCLDIEMDIRLRNDGRVDASLLYTFSADMADFGRGFGSDEPWLLPLREKDFIQQTLREPGVELKRYRNRTDSEGRDLIEVKLRADSLESLSSYLGLDMILDGDNETGSMNFTIPSTDYYTSADSQFREIIDQIIGNSRFRISFKPPSVPINTNPGFIDGKTAVLDLSLGDILHGETVDTWVVNW